MYQAGKKACLTDQNHQLPLELRGTDILCIYEVRIHVFHPCLAINESFTQYFERINMRKVIESYYFHLGEIFHPTLSRHRR